MRLNVHESLATTVKRIEPRTYSADTSVDHTSITPKRNDFVGCFGRSDRSRLVPGDDITSDKRGAMVRNGLSSGPLLVSVLGKYADRRRTSA